MKVALDYDGTITLDHAFWLAFYHMARAAGHEVIVVTMRYKHEKITNWPGPVLYTEKRAKKPSIWKRRFSNSLEIKRCQKGR